MCNSIEFFIWNGLIAAVLSDLNFGKWQKRSAREDFGRADSGLYRLDVVINYGTYCTAQSN